MTRPQHHRKTSHQNLNEASIESDGLRNYHSRGGVGRPMRRALALTTMGLVPLAGLAAQQGQAAPARQSSTSASIVHYPLVYRLRASDYSDSTRYVVVFRTTNAFAYKDVAGGRTLTLAGSNAGPEGLYTVNREKHCFLWTSPQLPGLGKVPVGRKVSVGLTVGSAARSTKKITLRSFPARTKSDGSVLIHRASFRASVRQIGC